MQLWISLVALCVPYGQGLLLTVNLKTGPTTRKEAIVLTTTGIFGLTCPNAALALGVQANLLEDCPQAPSCVSTQDDRPYPFMEPWVYEKSIAKAMEAIKRYISFTFDRVNFVAESERYLRVEVIDTNKLPPGGTTIDDMEFYFTPSDQIIQFRVNRRDSVTDFGMNRRRMDKMRIALGFDTVPVLRNRKRTLIFGESPLDSFGPSGYFDEVPEEMERGLSSSSSMNRVNAAGSRGKGGGSRGGAVWGELDPLAPVFESVTPTQELTRNLQGWWQTQ